MNRNRCIARRSNCTWCVFYSSMHMVVYLYVDARDERDERDEREDVRHSHNYESFIFTRKMRASLLGLNDEK